MSGTAQVRMLPHVSALSPLQQQGVCCVWCNTRLRTGTAVDLGARTSNLNGCLVRWFPRSCPQPCPKGRRP